MNISSRNLDSAKEEDTQRDIINNMTRYRIHISTIQETHIIQESDYIRDNYRVIASAAAKR